MNPEVILSLIAELYDTSRMQAETVHAQARRIAELEATIASTQETPDA